MVYRDFGFAVAIAGLGLSVKGGMIPGPWGGDGPVIPLSWSTV
ncbi:MAG: hypothetical protein ACYSUI_21275 [Planctomycetota bacterium]|jgi:hypothetical protein